jgi:hypothetical protein
MSKIEGRGAERDYLSANFLSRNTLEMIKKMKQQFATLLRDIGFYHGRYGARFSAEIYKR